MVGGWWLLVGGSLDGQLRVSVVCFLFGVFGFWLVDDEG